MGDKLGVIGTLTAKQGSWDPNASPERKIQWLKIELDLVAHRFGVIESQIESLRSRLAQRIDGLERDLRNELSAISTRLASEHQEVVRANSRGIWLIGSGTVLSGFSAGIATAGPGGWVVLAVIVVLSAAIFAVPWLRNRTRTRSALASVAVRPNGASH
jgi:hypothetical protein